MARLPAGQKPTPHLTRLASYRAELVNNGGHRLIADLERPAHEALRAIMERETPALSQKAAVTAALIDFAAKKPKRGK